jgi:transposase-like protein
MSQQGKAYTPEERANIIESLKPFLEMGFSRKKACAFIGFDDSTLSKWVQEDKGLSTKLTGWENVNTALALANIHQALLNESNKAIEHGETRMENSWKLVSKLEDGYKDKIDVTSNDEKIETPILVKFIDNAGTNSNRDTD